MAHGPWPMPVPPAPWSRPSSSADLRRRRSSAAVSASKCASGGRRQEAALGTPRPVCSELACGYGYGYMQRHGASSNSNSITAVPSALRSQSVDAVSPQHRGQAKHPRPPPCTSDTARSPTLRRR
ncbi:hypothetical protein JI435_440490 [Parastagonospora nodorum SN15]|uniref:Uncharacterized protein n=1 Tax=Phaeosphaeria nodorum (strain SN15 / ATCC MYA-4574 / FGSC 10173) TaxID=321614 RepID=A0A7U2FBH2_PHANO|nr:hypothetical protein JI435_440490 [Parastagonospora nodorum SN15]